MRNAIFALALVAAVASATACKSEPATPLSRAAADGNNEELLTLIGSGAEVDARDDNGMTALAWSARNGQLETLRTLLLYGARPDLPDADNGWPPLVHAIHRGQNEAAIELLDAGADVLGAGGRRALRMAAGYGNAGMVRELLARGADPYVEGLLTEAVGGAWDIDFRWAGCDPHTDTVRVLLEAAPELELGEGFWAHWALAKAEERGCTEILKLLEEEGEKAPA
jgi:ankyrin repeat protein